MKKEYVCLIFLAMFLSCGGGSSSSAPAVYSEVCGTCNGYGVVVDQTTGLKKICPSCGNPCTTCGGYGLVTDYYGNVQNCTSCGGSGKRSGGSNVSFGAHTTTFKKTNAQCDECSCSGYWGTKHDAGTYEGACSNTDQFGHSCGHSPSHHGLREY